MNDSSPFTLCNVAQDQMPEVQVVAHLLAIALGVVIKGFFFPGNSGFECPPCVLTCGNVSCPSRSCTTGHIEIGNFSLLVLTGLVILSLGLSWWSRRVNLVSKDMVSGRQAIVDGRRALGPSSQWRPEARG